MAPLYLFLRICTPMGCVYTHVDDTVRERNVADHILIAVSWFLIVLTFPLALCFCLKVLHSFVITHGNL